MKNYELIQQMSIEELADVIECPKTFSEEKIHCGLLDLYGPVVSCTQCKMAWLEEEG